MRNFKTMMVLLTAAAAFGVFGAWFGQGPKRQIVTLVVTGNYKSPRLMAELIQSESRQPYLLLPTDSGDSRIFFCPAQGPSLQIAMADLNDFVRYLNPKRIVVLGDERYVQPKYLAALDHEIPIVQVTGKDWNKIAEELCDMLNLSRLDGDYKDLREKMLNEGDSFRPISRPAAARPAADSAPRPAAVPAAAAQEEPVNTIEAEEIPVAE